MAELQAFGGGLEVLCVKKMISNVPELLKPLFVCMGVVKPMM